MMASPEFLAREHTRLWVFSWAACASALNAIHLALFMIDGWWPHVVVCLVLTFVTVRQVRILVRSLEIEDQRVALTERSRRDLARHAGMGFIPNIIGEA